MEPPKAKAAGGAKKRRRGPNRRDLLPADFQT